MTSKSRLERKPSVLVVDDDATLCEALARGFAARGFDARIALTGDEASRMIGEDVPQYAIIDLRLRKHSDRGRGHQARRDLLSRQARRRRRDRQGIPPRFGRRQRAPQWQDDVAASSGVGIHSAGVTAAPR